MKTETIVDTYNRDTKAYDKVKLFVRNVWNAKYLVELEIQGEIVQVHSAELRKAIENATNNEVK